MIAPYFHFVLIFLFAVSSGGSFLREENLLAESVEGDEREKAIVAVDTTTLEQSTLAISCSKGLTACPAGINGPGGCYKSGSTCNQGLICSFGLTACPKGNYGLGGCYSSGSTCNQGLICSFGLTACPAGNNGLGGCYSSDLPVIKDLSAASV